MKLVSTSALVLGALLIFANPIFGQQFEVLYPNGLTAIAKKSLPKQIYLSQKNVLKIVGEFSPKGQPNVQPVVVWGSGFIEKESGYVVSARHLLVETTMNLAERYNEPFNIDKNGVLRGLNYDYRFYAVLYTATERLEYPLEVAAMSPMGTYADVILFKPLNKIPVNGLALSSNIKSGDKVYASGFTAQGTHYHKTNGETVWITTDEIKFTPEHIILAVLQNKTIASIGVNKLYRLAEPTQPGFSGGPVLNRAGQAVGMIIERDTLFAFVISSDDIAAVIKSIK